MRELISSAETWAIRYQGVSVLGLLAVAAIARLLAIAVIGDIDPATAQLWEYGQIARLWIENGELVRPYPAADGVAVGLYPTAFMPPLPIWIWMGSFSVFGDTSAALIAVLGLNLFLGLFVVFVTGKIAQVLFNNRLVSLGAMAIIAIYPTFVASVATYHAIQIYIAFLLAGIWFVLARERLSSGHAIALGAIGGLAALTRTEYVVMFGALYAVAFFPKRHFGKFALATLVSAAIIVPWTVRNYLVLNEFVPIANSMGFNLFKGFNPEANGSGDWVDNNGVRQRLLGAEIAAIPYSDHYESDLDALFLQNAQKFIRDNPVRSFVLLPVEKLALFWVFDFHDPMARHPGFQLGFWPIFFLTLAGLYLWYRQPGSLSRPHKIALTLFAVQSLVMTVYAVHLRYRMNMEPILFGYAAFGALEIVRAVTRNLPAKRAR